MAPRLTELLPRTGVRVRAFEPASVTVRAPDEVEPERLGSSRLQVEAIWGAVVDYYRRGLHPALALAIFRRGALVLDRAIGHRRGNHGEDSPGPPAPVDRETLYSFFSGTKAMTAMLVHLLIERGELDLDDRVTRVLPSFGRHGKSPITLRHLLTHRAGIPSLDITAHDLALLSDPDAILEVLADLRPESPAGRTQAYHALSSGFVLGEVVRRVTGADVRELFARWIAGPAGIGDLGFGLGPDTLDRAALHAFTGPPSRWPFKGLMERSLGVDLPEIVRTANRAEFMTAVVPSANVFGTARAVAEFFELLRNKGTLRGARVFSPATVLAATRPTPGVALDDIIKLPIRYSAGFMLGTQPVSLYGPSTARAFGHLGFTNVIAWADPERDLAVAFMNTGKPFITPELLYWRRVLGRIADAFPRDGDRDWSLG